MANQIQIRRDTSTNWASTNPVLANGEMGYDTTLKKIKVGDGTTAWASLSDLQAMGEWRDVVGMTALPASGIALNTDFYIPQSVAFNTTFTYAGVFYFDPADYAVTGRTTQVRLTAFVGTGTAPTAHTMTASLYLATSGALAVPAKSGAAVCTAAVSVTNTATAKFQAQGTAVTAPVAGHYIVLGNNSATPGQTVAVGWKLQVRVV